MKASTRNGNSKKLEEASASGKQIVKCGDNDEACWLY